MSSYLSQSLAKEISNLYGLRTWVEYGFNEGKNYLGWADFRVTYYAQIERWWQVEESAYLMISLRFNGLASDSNQNITLPQADLLNKFQRHPYWSDISAWKHWLNNLQLIIQPYIYYCLIKPWLQVFDS